MRLDERINRSPFVDGLAERKHFSDACVSLYVDGEPARRSISPCDQLLLARQSLERKLVGRRTLSRLPRLVDLVRSRPMVSAGMIAAEVGVTMHAAIKLAVELELRELTGRGRYRAWGVL